MSDVDKNSIYVCMCVFVCNKYTMEVMKELKSQNTTVQNYSIG
jgi:hypothetical protein